MGLSQPELDGIRSALLARSAKLDNASKLQLAIDLMPAEQAVSVHTFMDEMTALRLSIMQRGQTALLALSDEEWENWNDA